MPSATQPPIVAAIDESAIAASLALWKQLALIASYGGIGAVVGLPVGATREHLETRRPVREAITEASDVARASGVNFTDADEERRKPWQDETFPPIFVAAVSPLTCRSRS